MGEMIDIASKQPHLTGKATCMGCKHTWTAVAPVGVQNMECSECGCMKGAFVYPIVGESFWECDCGSRYFSVSGISMNILCINCGLPQVFSS